LHYRSVESTAAEILNRGPKRSEDSLTDSHGMIYLTRPFDRMVKSIPNGTLAVVPRIL